MEWGWVVHLIGDHFAEDAQDVGDDEWTEYGRSIYVGPAVWHWQLRLWDG
jgi:hypothetical protein